MTSRFRFRMLSNVVLFTIFLALAGCGDSFNSGPMTYVESEKLAVELKGKDDLQKSTRKAISDLFGDDPTHIRVPRGSGLPGGGIYLANHQEVAKGEVKQIKLVRPGTNGLEAAPQEGGYALYRKHCLHCHGVSGAGDGPTSTFLYPRPRDYRKGIFKFTSTTTGAKPSRSDLRKTIRHGLHGTSMPSFEALMSDSETEQVIDYMLFLTYRGETELALIDEVAATGELTAETAVEVSTSVFAKWKAAENQVVNPPIPRTPSTRESILRGRELFLGKTSNKLECTGCHGAKGIGDGPSFINQNIFNDVVFGGDPSSQKERLEKIVEATAEEEAKRSGDPKTGEAAASKLREAWKNSLDDWGNPFRPANLNRGIYKGGRRPIDLYWRIAKGINGAKMPAHYPAIDHEKIWDLVNFVLALPYEPALLDGAVLPGALAPPPKVANR